MLRIYYYLQCWDWTNWSIHIVIDIKLQRIKQEGVVDVYNRMIKKIQNSKGK